jgi:hypothetical protein
LSAGQITGGNPKGAWGGVPFWPDAGAAAAKLQSAATKVIENQEEAARANGIEMNTVDAESPLVQLAALRLALRRTRRGRASAILNRRSGVMRLIFAAPARGRAARLARRLDLFRRPHVRFR